MPLMAAGGGSSSSPADGSVSKQQHAFHDPQYSTRIAHTPQHTVAPQDAGYVCQGSTTAHNLQQ
jgi:hypothetical protein